MSNQGKIGIAPAECYNRESFEVKGLKFLKIGPGHYSNGKITAYCDQQDSTSWAASVGDLRTGYFWYPEYAVENLLNSLEKLK